MKNRLVFTLPILLALVAWVNAAHSQTPLTLNMAYPTNGQTFTTPTNIYVHAAMSDSNLVNAVQYFANDQSIGIISSSSGVSVTNTSSGNPFALVWSNAPAGNYALHAVMLDDVGNIVTSAPVNITVTNLPPPPPVPFYVTFWYPANGETFTGPTNIGVHALVTDSNIVEEVQYFANGASIGVVSNTSGVLLTSTATDSPFYMLWSNVPPGSYTLQAVALDSAGLTDTSAPVNITVISNPPPVVRPSVGIYSPANGSVYIAPADVNIYARAVESGGMVATVQFFANDASLGVVSNSSQVVVSNISSEPVFPLAWTNVPAGSYALHVVATDALGNSSTSAVVNITVTNKPSPPPVPFVATLFYPTNGQIFILPATIYVHAMVTDSNPVTAIQYFANDVSIGIITNSPGVLLTNTASGNPFALFWTNPPAGNYALHAVAFDNAGLTATSAPVDITVTNPPPPPPVPFVVTLFYPTNGQIFTLPTNIYVHAMVTDSNPITAIQYFANDVSIGIASNSAGILLTNTSNGNPFYITWTNPPAGSYALHAVAFDNAGLTATSAPVNITVTNPPPPPPVPFVVTLFYPTNGQTFTAPTNLYVHAMVTDSNPITAIQYFANDVSIGIASNSAGVLLTNTSNGNPFYITWTNPAVGSYTLQAVAFDNTGLTATSAPVDITITNPPPPPPVPFVVTLFYPTNNQTFTTPTNLYVHAMVTDSNPITAIQYFANDVSIGIASNSAGVLLTNTSNGNPFYITWTNPAAGNYALHAVAFDNTGLTATSAPVDITVTNRPPPPPVPFYVSFYYPTNGQTFTAPANIGVHALVTDSNPVVAVQYFADGASIGVVSNTGGVLLTGSTAGNPFFLDWSNVPPGDYALQAVAFDNAGLTATSAPVDIFVLTSPPPVVTIYAPDPVAVEGTNYPAWLAPEAITASNYWSGTNTATFLVDRNGDTNTDQTVQYAIGGTAVNGVDYEAIPNSVTIPAGQRYALITIMPLEDTANTNRYDTVTISLLALPTSVDSPLAYSLGSPSRAGAVIVEDNILPITQPLVHGLADHVMHISLPASNGMNFCLQVTSNYVTWTSICTNTVLKGSAQFVDPDASANPNLFYRIVPATQPPAY